MNMISPNYFATMGVPVVAGRDFTMAGYREGYTPAEKSER